MNAFMQLNTFIFNWPIYDVEWYRIWWLKTASLRLPNPVKLEILLLFLGLGFRTLFHHLHQDVDPLSGFKEQYKGTASFFSFFGWNVGN